jgi:hypothetical protein
MIGRLCGRSRKSCLYLRVKNRLFSTEIPQNFYETSPKIPRLFLASHREFCYLRPCTLPRNCDTQ